MKRPLTAIIIISLFFLMTTLSISAAGDNWRGHLDTWLEMQLNYIIPQLERDIAKEGDASKEKILSHLEESLTNFEQELNTLKTESIERAKNEIQVYESEQIKKIDEWFQILLTEAEQDIKKQEETFINNEIEKIDKEIEGFMLDYLNHQ